MEHLDESKVLFLRLSKSPEKLIAELNNITKIVVYMLQDCHGSDSCMVYMIQDYEERPGTLKFPECLKSIMYLAEENGVEVFCLKNGKGEQTIKEGKMLTLSTGHISSITARYLDMEQTPSALPVSKKGEYGWFINLRHAARMSNLRIPSDLGRVLRFAISRGYDILCLDRDGGRVNGLPFFEW